MTTTGAGEDLAHADDLSERNDVAQEMARAWQLPDAATSDRDSGLRDGVWLGRRLARPERQDLSGLERAG